MPLKWNRKDRHFIGFHVSIVCIAFQAAPHAQVDFDSRVNGIQEGTHIPSDFKSTDGRTHKQE